jgi:hypothetical protein
MSGNFFRPDSGPPPKWFRVRTISGKDAGLGFQCPCCHLGYPHSAPERVFHCGAFEEAPLITGLLPVRQLGQRAHFPRNIMPVGWED